MIAKYLKTTYRKGGRGPIEYDCWGLVREVHHEYFGRPLLPSLTEATPGAFRRITESVHAAHQDVLTYDVDIRPGAIVEAWMGSLCVHIGIVVEVDRRLMILETDNPNGPVLTKPPLFVSRYTKVRFFDTQQ